MSDESQTGALRLCYVSRPWAWFTTKPLDEQWGDDWNDAPYQHNAGWPYRDEEYTYVKVAFEGPFYAPGESPRGEIDGLDDSWNGVSVEEMNREERHPWLIETNYGDLYGERGVEIWAGTTLKEFIGLVEDAGGSVYLRS
jgi:hypothetical protein